MTGFESGQRVRIVDSPSSITDLQAGREGVYLGPHARVDGLVDVGLDSGSFLAPAVRVTLRPHDLEAVA